MSTNNQRCGVDGNTIYYDTETIDLKSTPTGKTAFEAVFLSDVISEISGQCFSVQENCKTLYPEITSSNWRNWITSVDQENRMSLAHTLEKSDIPILYNTPRLCDPGVSISKNWSLRNYIETRLYLFKFKYNFKNIQLTRNANKCYPSILFDFRPFQYKLALPVTTGNAPDDIFVTEYITVDSTSGAEGYTPHMSFSKNGTTFPSTNKPRSSTVIFDAMVKKLISTKLGNSNSSIINQKLNLGPNNREVNQSFLNNFRKFIEDYDGAQFDSINKNKLVPIIKLTDDVIRVLFYDLYHDKVVSKNDFADFKSQFKYQFRKSIDFDTTSFAGAKSTGKAYAEYGDIFFTVKGQRQQRKKIKQIPAICKTLGDLSQFIYAAQYNTVIASGDKMGIATGLYINATMNKPVKCMMEDVITGFIIYSGLPEIKFIRKTTCVSSTNNRGLQCRLNGKTNKSNIKNRILRSVPSNKINNINIIIKRKPSITGIKELLNLTKNAAKNQNINSVKATFNTFKKSYTYLNDTNLKKIIDILNVYSNKNNIPGNTKINIAAFKGQIQAQIEKNKPQTGNNRKHNNNNNGNAIRSARRVNTIRPVIMKMSHLTNNQKAYYINQAKTNSTKLLSEIVKNARLRAYRRT